MKKIVIFGNSGSGKTTLAIKLQQQFDLTHLDLDLFAWTEANLPSRKKLSTSIREIDDRLSQLTGWIVEGCYADLLGHVINTANEVIFLNPGTETCIENCYNRPWEPHKYASKQEQDNNLGMLIDWVKQYESREDEFSLKAHKSLFESFSGTKIELQKGESFSL